MKEHLLKDGGKLLVREATEDDAEGLISFLGVVSGETDFLTFGRDTCRKDVEAERNFLRETKKQHGSVFLVGYLGKELVCTANLGAPQKARLAHNCEMGITVKKKYWHLGAASALLTDLIEFAEKDPVLRTMHLGVYENNTRAIRLYEKFGFREVGRHKDFFRVGDSFFDEILMNRDIS